jgi:hypothetical protein
MIIAKCRRLNPFILFYGKVPYMISIYYEKECLNLIVIWNEFSAFRANFDRNGKIQYKVMY